jgi:hypothetical protein
MDRLIGAAGKDHLFGGPEGDHLNSKDGVNGNDTDNGGTGTDTCRADPLDALTSCEHNP